MSESTQLAVVESSEIDFATGAQDLPKEVVDYEWQDFAQACITLASQGFMIGEIAQKTRKSKKLVAKALKDAVTIKTEQTAGLARYVQLQVLRRGEVFLSNIMRKVVEGTAEEHHYKAFNETLRLLSELSGDRIILRRSETETRSAEGSSFTSEASLIAQVSASPEALSALESIGIRPAKLHETPGLNLPGRNEHISPISHTPADQ